jgi:HSP20 family protein
MNDFFEKLKKGMDAEKPIEPVEPVEPIELPNSQPQADLVVASVAGEIINNELEKKIRPKKRKRAVKRKNKEDEGKIKVEKIPLVKKKKTISDGFLDIENEDWLDKEKIGQLTVDLYQTDKEIIIQSAIAGVEPEDLDITIEDDLVIIKGKREKKLIEEKRNYFYQECHWGQFYREIILPAEADSSKAVASMEQGILTIKIPKTGTETKKKIEIK